MGFGRHDERVREGEGEREREKDQNAEPSLAELGGSEACRGGRTKSHPSRLRAERGRTLAHGTRFISVVRVADLAPAGA